MKKRAVSMLLAGAVALSLAACGGSGGSSGAAGSGSAKEADPGSAKTEGPGSGEAADPGSAKTEEPGSGEAAGPGSGSSGGTKLTIWTWDPSFNIAAMNTAIEMYKADHPDFDAEVIETPSDDCETKLTTCANSGDYGTMADIVLMQDNSYQKFLASYPDAFTDLSDIGIDWSQFPELKQSYSMVGGAHYGVPFDNGAVIGCYRTDILEQAGYTVDDLTDITWTRFMEIGQDLYARTGKYLLSSDSNGGDTLMMMIFSCGAGVVDEDGNPFIADNEAVKACVDIYAQMIRNNVVLLVNSWDDYIKSITTGQTAGIVNGNWITGTLMSTEDQAGLWEITTMPRVDGIDTATNYANNGGSSWYVSSNCRDVALAKDFLLNTFGNNTDFYDAILPSTGAIACYLPAAGTEAYNEPSDYFNGQPIFSTIVEYSGHIPSYNRTPYHYESRAALNTAVQQIVDGADMETALREAQDTLAFNMGQ